MFILDNWNNKEYEKLLLYLKSIGDEKYIDFTKKITPGEFKMLGIKIPILRKIVKEICKGNYNSFLKVNKNDYFEELLIEGFVIGNIKNTDDFDKYVELFIKKINNWCICDTCISSFKIIKKNRDRYFYLVDKYSKSDKEFEIRASLIMLLSLYKNKDYLNQIFSIIKNIKYDYYYVNMAKAWLLCELFINFKEETLNFIRKNRLDEFTIRKFVSKCNDSYRVSIEDKKMLKEMISSNL
ncbi:MAG: DNA alkylation repair protein [Bacilli bacterium]